MDPAVPGVSPTSEDKSLVAQCLFCIFFEVPKSLFTGDGSMDKILHPPLESDINTDSPRMRRVQFVENLEARPMGQRDKIETLRWEWGGLRKEHFPSQILCFTRDKIGIGGSGSYTYELFW